MLTITPACRFIVNDTFRCSLCLIHPPHLIALAAIYLAFALHPPAANATQILGAEAPSTNVSSRTRRRSTDPNNSNATPTDDSKPANDPVSFLASLQVDQSLVLEIIQEIISLYDLWAQLEAPAVVSSPAAQQLGVGASARLSAAANGTVGAGVNVGGKGTPDDKVIAIIRRMQEGRMRELRDERSKLAAARKVG